MALPENFNEWEHLQSVLMRVHNREVKDEFKDISDDVDIDINIPRQSLKQACLIKDTDTSEMTHLRMMLYWFNLRKAQDLQVPVYGQLLPDVQATRTYKPQIQLYFQEQLTGAEEEGDYPAVTGEISIRLMNQTSETLTKQELITYANKVKQVFGTPPLHWDKGKDLASYTDKEKGYQLQLLVRNKADAKSLIENILDIQEHTPNWKYLNYKENDEPTEAFPTLPPTKSILGKTRRMARTRPIARVTFQRASCHIYGLPKAITLYDATQISINALVN